MNWSLYSLDRMTHIKIAVVAALAAALVLVVGESSRIGQGAPALSLAAPHQLFASAVPG